MQNTIMTERQKTNYFFTPKLGPIAPLPAYIDAHPAIPLYTVRDVLADFAVCDC